MKKRGLASPDIGDALTVWYAPYSTTLFDYAGTQSRQAIERRRSVQPETQTARYAAAPHPNSTSPAHMTLYRLSHFGEIADTPLSRAVGRRRVAISYLVDAY